MAIDPSISLQVRPPQFQVPFPQPIEQLGQILSLRDMMTQGQAHQIGLQSEMLKLEQQRQAINEQRWLADQYAKQYDAANAPDTTVNVGPPPVQPTPAGGTVAQTAPAVIAPIPNAPNVPPAMSAIPNAPNTPAPLMPIPNAPNVPPAMLGGAAVPVPNTPAAIAPNFGQPAKPLAAPPIAYGGSGGFVGPSMGEVLRNMPFTGMGYLQKQTEFQKAQSEAALKDAEVQAKHASGLAGLARGVEAASDKPAAFNNAIYTAVENRWMTPAEGRAFQARGYNHDDMVAFIERADNFKDFHEANKADIESLDKAQNQAREWLLGVNDQATYDRGFPTLDPRVQRKLGPVYSPQLKTLTAPWGVPAADVPKFQMGTREAAAGQLAAAMSRGKQAFNDELYSGKYDPDTIALYKSAPDERGVMLRAQSPDKFMEEQRLNRGQALEAERVRIDRGKFLLDQQKNNALFGPGTAESWAATIYQNPDAVGEVPGDVRSATQQIFQQKYGLPWPRQLQGAEKQTESAAQSTLGDLMWIRNAMQNPNIAKNIGPILGNLQNIEQATGVASGLTGADAQMAQEFRNRVRGMIVNEAGAMRSRGVPSNIINDLVQGSPRINMDEKMFRGALDGVEGAVRNKLNTAEQSRFGAGHMRPPEARGLQATTPSAAQQAVLSGLPRDGKAHQLSDGSAWILNKDGTITPTNPQ